MKPRYLIVIPYLPWGASWKFYEIPMGIAYISAILKREGYVGECVNLAEYNLDYIGVEIGNKIAKADVVLCGGMSSHYNQIKALLAAAKSIKPGITTITGGGIISSEPELASSMLGADISISGEAEKCLLDVFDKISRKDGIPKGSVFKASSYVDMDTLPFPDYDSVMGPTWLSRQHSTANIYLYKHDKPRAMPVVTTRGCPYSCGFCFSPLGRTYRERSLDKVFEDIELLCSRYNINILNIHDEVMSLKEDRLYEFCKRIKSFKLDWITELRVNTVDRDMIKAMKDAGCYLVNFGIENTNPSILESLNKRITKEEIESVLDWCYQEGLGVAGNILMWSEAETLDTFRNSLKWLTDNKRYTLTCAPLQVYPGSPIYKSYVSKGIIEPRKHLEAGCPFPTKPPNMTEKDKHIAQDEYVNWQQNKDIVPGDVVFMYKTGDNYIGNTYEAAVVCPHCDNTNHYKELSYTTYMTLGRPNILRVGCRNCNWRFDIKRPA